MTTNTNNCDNSHGEQLSSLPSTTEEGSSSSSSSSKGTEEWKLENSSFYWLGHPFFQNPGNVLLLSSIPFCAGAYLGYRTPTKKMEDLIGLTEGGKSVAKSSQEVVDPIELAERRAAGFRMASRALRLATFSSIGCFGMLGAAGFYAFGYQTLDEAIDKTRKWSSSWMRSFEGWLGVEDTPSRNHPEVVATRHMTEDEEMNYIYEKYIKEPPEPSPSSSSSANAASDNAE